MLSDELIGESFIRFIPVNLFIQTIHMNQCTKMNWTVNSMRFEPNNNNNQTKNSFTIT